MPKNIHRFLFLFAYLYTTTIFSQESISIETLTNRIILIHFDEGSVEYAKNKLNKKPLHTLKSDLVETYTITSTQDSTYFSPKYPIRIGRKTKATEYLNFNKNWTGKSFDPTSEPWASEHWLYVELENPLKTGLTYQLNLNQLYDKQNQFQFVYDNTKSRSEAIHVNTIGYATDAPKYGYIYHWAGSLKPIDFSLYAKNGYKIIDVSTGKTIQKGRVTYRKSATNKETSSENETPNDNFLGSDVYEVNFSDVTQPGIYKLIVDGIGCSYPFKIGKDPIWEAYYAVFRSLYHQRNGIRIEENYNGKPYIRPANQNPLIETQEKGAISFKNRILYSKFLYTSWDNDNDGGTTIPQIVEASEGNFLDISGWYHDAGDWDAYYTHQRVPILLMTYFEYFPTMSADDEMNIPESGNGIPDLIDEASWLIKFNYRLKKEIEKRGYSDGGLGGARIAPDPFTTKTNNPESEGKASWQDTRNYAVTPADAFMTYFYAGQAAQLALVLKKLGKNPEKYSVELLDALTFEEMTYDKVNWIKESEAAFNWANKDENKPASNKNYSSPLFVYQCYAAVNLYRLTGKSVYHKIAKVGLEKILQEDVLVEDLRYAPYCYMLANNIDVDEALQNEILNLIKKTANKAGLEASEKRATRWGGYFDFPMLIGQGTTPWTFENIIAYGLTKDIKYKNVVHQTVDYFLGTNPLNSTNMTGIGPNPIHAAFNLDARHMNSNWQVYPGWIPYGQWRVAASDQLFEFKMPDSISRKGGMGPWNEHWSDFSVFPVIDKWPGHERIFDNIHSPMATENTVHQNDVHAAISYGFVNGRYFENRKAEISVDEIIFQKTNHTFTTHNETFVFSPKVSPENATFPFLKWESSNETIVHIDQFGRATATGSGIAKIICSTYDNSIKKEIKVKCQF
jgi:hypothetical protein